MTVAAVQHLAGERLGTGQKVLILDGTERAGLAVARALVAAGYEVHVAAPRRLSLAGVSRGVHACSLETDPLDDPARYAAEVGRLVRTREIQVLLPLTDASVEAVLEYRASFPPDLAVPLPDLATYRRASDKLEMLELARASGFAVPETVVARSAAEGDVLAATMSFPAAVKPHRSVVSAGGGRARHKTGVTMVADTAAMRAALAALPPAAFPVLLQRRIHGPGEGLFLLRWDGQTRARFAHRRLREKPPAGGVSVYRESIAPPPDLVRAGERLLEALDWRGVAMIECKRDETTGRHVLMEINGRFWGSLQLAIDAGVDFPALLVACALGHTPPPADGRPYQIGIRSRWLWGDVDHLYLRLRRSSSALQLSGGAGSRVRALLEFLAFRPGRDRSEVWRWRDPAPFLLETLQRVGLLR
jgi:predicted ATP-grasp superfamily ATP-dependent carboligase